MLKYKRIIIVMIMIIILILIPVIIIKINFNRNISGVFYGEGNFGSIQIVVKDNSDVIKYSFNFTDDYVKQALKEKKYYLKFVANVEFNIERDTSKYTKENELLYKGFFRANLKKPFTLLNIRVNSHGESVKLKKISNN